MSRFSKISLATVVIITLIVNDMKTMDGVIIDYTPKSRQEELQTVADARERETLFKQELAQQIKTDSQAQKKQLSDDHRSLSEVILRKNDEFNRKAEKLISQRLEEMQKKTDVTLEIIEKKSEAHIQQLLNNHKALSERLSHQGDACEKTLETLIVRRLQLIQDTTNQILQKHDTKRERLESDYKDASAHLAIQSKNAHLMLQTMNAERLQEMQELINKGLESHKTFQDNLLISLQTLNDKHKAIDMLTQQVTSMAQEITDLKKASSCSLFKQLLAKCFCCGKNKEQ
ncbi:MAG: hypothetical protein NTX86_03540 [Candidatus Dependentiae bacterium]|nr:hypothetical protein [Candidatus Dependentiae bacterium]